MLLSVPEIASTTSLGYTIRSDNQEVRNKSPYHRSLGDLLAGYRGDSGSSCLSVVVSEAHLM